MQQMLIERIVKENKNLREENKLLKKMINDRGNYKLSYLMGKLGEALKRLKQGKYYTREQLGL